MCAALTHACLVLQGMWPQEGVIQPLIKVPYTVHCGAVQNILEGAAGGIVSEPVVLLLCVSLVHHVSQEPIHFYSSSPDHRAADPLKKNCSSLLVWYFFFKHLTHQYVSICALSMPLFQVLLSHNTLGIRFNTTLTLTILDILYIIHVPYRRRLPYVFTMTLSAVIITQLDSLFMRLSFC